MADTAGKEIVAAPVDAPRAALTPFELLDRALERGADITILDKLMDLQERHEKNQARKAFDAAVADAKSEIKPVKKNRTGNNSSKYADLAAYAKEIDPILAKYGLSYRYRSHQGNGVIEVTCILSHRDGHCEETTLSGAADATGSKNSIQAIGSTVTYLQRYTLTLALGLAAAEDDDGRSADGDEPISEAQLIEIRTKLESADADIAAFCKYLKVEALPDIRKNDYPKALAALAQKMKAKKSGGAK